MNSLEKNEGEDNKLLRISSLFAASMLLLSLCIPKVEAYPITIEIEAVVDSVEDEDNYLEGQIEVDDIITGYYTYESTTPDSSPLDPTVGHYNHDTIPAGIFLTVGSFDFKTDPCNIDFRVDIVNDSTSGGLHDGYGIISYNNDPLYNGLPIEIISWWLEDDSASALQSDALITNPPVLDKWQSDNNLTIWGGTKLEVSIRAHVTSAIPEPATILLLSFGLMLLRKK